MENENTSPLGYIKKSFELKNSKLYKEAIEMLYKALECEEGRANAETISQIGDLYLLLKNPDRALEEYEKALDIDKKHVHSLEQIVSIYFALGKYSRSLEVSQKLTQAAPTAEHYANHLKILYKLGNFERMKNIFEGLNDDIKNNAEILFIMSKTGFYPKIEMLEKAVKEDKNFVNANLDLALEYYKTGEFEKAKELFQNILTLGKNPLAYYFLGVIEHQGGNFYKAINYYLECIKCDRANEKCYFELAKAYIDINWLNEAQIALLSSINLLKLKAAPEPEKLDEHHFLLAWIMTKKEDLKNAKLYLDLIGENSKMYPNAQILKSTLNVEGGNWAGAKSVLENYYKNDKNYATNPILMETLGKIYKHLKMYKEAIELYKTALKHYPDSIFYSIELIDVLIDNKDYNEALSVAHHIESKTPKCPNTYNAFARIYYRLKNYEAAIENLKKLNQLDKNNAEGFYFLGLVQNDTCQAKEALENLKIALTLNPTPAKYYSQTSRAYETMGDLQNALLYIKEAIEIAPQDINYMVQAKNIAQKMKDIGKASFYNSQIKRLEKLLKQRH